MLYRLGIILTAHFFRCVASRTSAGSAVSSHRSLQTVPNPCDYVTYVISSQIASTSDVL
jgi:hypothetical protein